MNKKIVSALVLLLLVLVPFNKAEAKVVPANSQEQLVYDVDPWFYFRNGIDAGTYRYPSNDDHKKATGVARNVHYPNIVIGNSLIQNTKASLVTNLFGGKTAKATNAGALWQQTNTLETEAIKNNPNLKNVFRTIDSSGFLVHEEKFGDVNSTLLNDANTKAYLSSPDAYKAAKYIVDNQGSISSSYNWDAQGEWYNRHYSEFSTYGTNFLSNPPKHPKVSVPSMESHRNIMADKIYNYIIKNPAENPHINFYYIIPPYAVGRLDMYEQNGLAELYVESYKMLVEETSKYPNIYLYSGITDLDTMSDLKNYKDDLHYSQAVMDQIYYDISSGQHRVTSSNKDSYIAELQDIFDRDIINELYFGKERVEKMPEAGTTVESSNGRWVSDGSNWYFEKNDGSYAKGEWLWLPIANQPNSYNFKYFNRDGKSIDQFFHESGKIWLSQAGPNKTYKTGWWTDPMNGQTYYFRTSGTMVHNWQYIDGNWYFFRDSGTMVRSSWVWTKTLDNGNFNFKYFNKDGKSVDQFYQQKDGRIWLSIAGPYADYYKGWWTDPTNGHIYYFRTSSGSRVEGWQWIDGSWRFFRINSGTQAFGWQWIDGSWYYLRPSNGSRVTGRQYIEQRWYNFDSNGKLK